MTIRVLMVEENHIMRALLMTRIADEPDIAVIATAANASEARELIRQFDPDVITLDTEIPDMNALDFLEKIMNLRPTPVIVVAGTTAVGDAVAARALALGAVDCYAKANRSGEQLLFDNGRLASLIRQAAQVRFSGELDDVGAAPMAIRRHSSQKINVVAIGASTGGVEALQVLLKGFPAECPPTLIVQHVNARFAEAIAKSLDTITPAKVMLAEHDMPLRQGTIYLAPGGDRHLTLANRGGFYTCLCKGDPINGHIPSVDALFSSVAEMCQGRSAGVLLTGMGCDGAKGLLEMAHAGALTIAQDEASSTVFGMPRAAIALGAASAVTSINRIAKQLFEGPY